MKDTWFKEHFAGVKASLPFSFTYDGQPSAKLLAEWSVKAESKRLDDVRTQHVMQWTNPTAGLEVRCVAMEYEDYPAVEWTVYFTNMGANNTPILENIMGIDTIFEGAGGEVILHGIKGDSNTPDSYEPYSLTLASNSSKIFAPNGGRPTNGAFPYYNLQTPKGGVMLAIGWPGQWAASFTVDAMNGVRIVAGQELTHFFLKSGESARTPLMVLLFWQGSDSVVAQNLWRRWMIAHNLPRTADGKPQAPIYFFCSGGFFEGLKVSEASEKKFIDVLIKEKIRIDYWWMDAGWYTCGNWPEVGTWDYDQERFPKGIKAVSEYVHGKGAKLILWFEPERVTSSSWLATRHSDWVLGGTLLNLGNLSARTWLTDHVDTMISEQGIDLYRQDFNMDPLDIWRKNDTNDRQGITENLHVQGYLAYWDELRRRHPGILIDSCASGGRRNDLETMRRAVPLLRSDYQAFDGNPNYAIGNQGHTYGLSQWLPYYGQGVYQTAQDLTYYVRSHQSPAFGFCVDVRKPGIDWNLYRQLAEQWRKSAPCMLGDYYPMTAYSLAANQWIAWQFNRPEEGDGMVQAFRRPACAEPSQTYRLRGLDPAAMYEVTNFDVKAAARVSGADMIEKGLTIKIKDRPGAAMIVYQRIKERK